MYDVIIIGKGPAGISASLYIQRAGINSLIIGKDLGSLGKTDFIENYYGFEEPIKGEDLILKGIKQAERLGAKIVSDEVINIEYVNKFIVKTVNSTFESTALILAMGANHNTSNIKGLKEFEGKGISYCAICDGFFYKGKDVAVLGEGDYAISEALELSPITNTVTILTNGGEEREVRAPNIKFNCKEIREFRGEDKIQKVEFNDNTNMDVSGIFIAEGVATSTALAKKLGINIKNNNIETDENMCTNINGLFSCR